MFGIIPGMPSASGIVSDGTEAANIDRGTLAGTPVRRVEGYVRHAPHVDAGCREGRAGTDAPAQSLLGDCVACHRAWLVDAPFDPRRSIVHDGVRLHRPSSCHPDLEQRP